MYLVHVYLDPQQWTVIKNQADALIHECANYYSDQFFSHFPLKYSCAKDISTRKVRIYVSVEILEN